MTVTHLTWNDSDAASVAGKSPSSTQVFRRDGPHGNAASSRQWLRRVFDTLPTWQERARGRHHLAHLDDHLLRDIGKTRADVALEIQKPFWRA